MMTTKHVKVTIYFLSLKNSNFCPSPNTHIQLFSTVITMQG